MQAETQTSQESSALSAPHQGEGEGLARLQAALASENRSGGRIPGVYVHIPFCFHKCHYCDFYSIVDSRERQGNFTKRLVDEIRAVAEIHIPRPETIFVGGGTPTLLEPDCWRELLGAFHRYFDLSALKEFTVEANPETVTPDLFQVLATGGVNRVSVGSQSFNTAHLKTLERWHDPARVAQAVEIVRKAGIENINLDHIFAIPGQTMDQWLEDLRCAVSLQPTHLSCYSLTYEPNTPLAQKLKAGRIRRADNALEAAMYVATIDTLSRSGYEPYEVSNFARSGHRCRHNLLYWQNNNWLAMGPSASGHLSGLRWKNVPHLGQYLASSGLCPVQDVEQLAADASLGERLMLAFRLTEGVDESWLAGRCEGRRRSVIEGYIQDGMMVRHDGRVRLSRRGLMLADGLLAELL